MTLPVPVVLDARPDPAVLDRGIEALPEAPAVFLAWPKQGAPYLGRTALLRRRLRRLFRQREGPSRLLNLRGLAERVEYWRTASRLESAFVFYELARRHYPQTYLKLANLRMPSYVKILLSGEFPRPQVTTRLSASQALHFGPFRSRAAAELFESQCLDLFQVRRCQEDLEPSAAHPGCIYGEMNLCLRPCQLVVGPEEYRSEVARLTAFLSSEGETLLETAAAARDRLSAAMEFEEAARQHKRYEKIQQVLRLRDSLACDIDRLHGVAVTPSTTAGAVNLWFLARGTWLAPRAFPVAPRVAEIVSMDARLREVVASLETVRTAVRERQEHLALLARWYYSSWRDGEWLSFESFEKAPYRKLVNAIHRAATGKSEIAGTSGAGGRV